MAISSLVAKAQWQGIQLYVQDGQVRINLQCPVDNIPGPVRQTLADLKQRKAELLAYFALTVPDIQLLLRALEAQGVQLVPDIHGWFKIHVNTTHLGRNYSIGMTLMQYLGERRSEVANYLYRGGV